MLSSEKLFEPFVLMLSSIYHRYLTVLFLQKENINTCSYLFIIPQKKVGKFLASFHNTFKRLKSSVIEDLLSLHEKCPNWSFSWSLFSRIWTRKNSEFGHFSHSNFLYAETDSEEIKQSVAK